jgi:hypothetical protein
VQRDKNIKRPRNSPWTDTNTIIRFNVTCRNLQNVDRANG